MEFFIQFKDGAPVEHPISGDNLRDVFPNWDFSSPPPGFAFFMRYDAREVPVGNYEVLVEEYVVEGEIVRDNWHTRPMTLEEKIAKLEILRAQPPVDGWVLDEDLGAWVFDLSMSGSAPDVDG